MSFTFNNNADLYRRVSRARALLLQWSTVSGEWKGPYAQEVWDKNGQEIMTACDLLNITYDLCWNVNYNVLESETDVQVFLLPHDYATAVRKLRPTRPDADDISGDVFFDILGPCSFLFDADGPRYVESDNTKLLYLV